MRSKLIYSNFDKETHISTVTIQTKEGVFSASVVTHPDDYDIESRYTGCGFAERKAEIKSLKAKLKRLREREKAYDSLLCNLWYFDDDKYTAGYDITRSYWLRTKNEIEELKDTINKATTKLKEDMLNQRQHIEEINEKRKKKIKWIDLGEINLENEDKNE